MIKIYCDRCGKEISEYTNYTISVQGPEITSFDNRYKYTHKQYQLCDSCMNDVHEFMTAKTDCPWK